MSSSDWNLSSIWNESFDSIKDREIEPRDYCYASELGQSYWDRYWRMKGRKPTTPPNLRARRKFQGGQLTEWIVLQILARAGVLKSTQEYIVNDDGPLRVTGRADFVAGGEIKLLTESDLQALPESFASVAESIVARLKESHPDGLREVNVEVKSTAGSMFDKYLIAPATHHALQAYHYAHNTDRPTLLIYVSRDDFRICTWVILPHSEKYGKLYQKDLDKMAEVISIASVVEEDAYTTFDPELDNFKEPLLVWAGGKFSSNWKITYSNYLTDYGYEYPEAYDKPAKSIALRLNNIVKKLKEGKELTKVNLATLEECYKFYPEAEEAIKNVKEKYETTRV